MQLCSEYVKRRRNFRFSLILVYMFVIFLPISDKYGTVGLCSGLSGRQGFPSNSKE